METNLLFAFISTTEHRITRAIWNAITLELRASVLARKSSLSFFFNGCLVSHGLYQAIISTVKQYPPTNNYTLHLHDHITTTIHDLNLQH